MLNLQALKVDLVKDSDVYPHLDDKPDKPDRSQNNPEHLQRLKKIRPESPDVTRAAKRVERAKKSGGLPPAEEQASPPADSRSGGKEGEERCSNKPERTKEDLWKEVTATEPPSESSDHPVVKSDKRFLCEVHRCGGGGRKGGHEKVTRSPTKGKVTKEGGKEEETDRSGSLGAISKTQKRWGGPILIDLLYSSSYHVYICIYHIIHILYIHVIIFRYIHLCICMYDVHV